MQHGQMSILICMPALQKNSYNVHVCDVLLTMFYLDPPKLIELSSHLNGSN